MLDSFLRSLVYFLIPIPLLKEALAEAVCKYKVIFLAFILAVFITPILLLTSAFGSGANVEVGADQEKMKRIYFDRQYNILCRETPDQCEPKPEYGSGVINCGLTPEMCRKKRPRVDCNNPAHQNKYCTLVTQTTIDQDGNSNSTSHWEKIPNADEIYYKDQQDQEEDKQNIFKWILDIIGGIVDGIDETIGSGSSNVQPIPEILKGYIEPKITDSGTPNGNPFGGSDYDNVKVTCVWHCGNYVAGLPQHQGMDMKPSSAYYSSNQASLKTGGGAIPFATCSGKAHSFTTVSSGNQVRIKCTGTDYYVTYMHLSVQYIGTQEVEIKAGSPIGVMGNTGTLTTGAHLHYQINYGCLAYSTACTKDPQPFISSKPMYNCNNCL